MKILRIIISGYEYLISLMNWASAFFIFLLMIIIVTDVSGRYFFNSPLTGVPELAKVSVVTFLYLGITKTLRMERHVRGTILANHMSSRSAAVLDVFAYSCGFLLFALFIYSSWPLAWAAWEVKEYEGEGSFHVPTFPLRALILFASALMCVQFVRGIIEVLVSKLNLFRRPS